MLSPELVRALVSVIERTEADDEVKVLVFRSADPEYQTREGELALARMLDDLVRPSE